MVRAVAARVAAAVEEKVAQVVLRGVHSGEAVAVAATQHHTARRTGCGTGRRSR